MECSIAIVRLLPSLFCSAALVGFSPEEERAFLHALSSPSVSLVVSACFVIYKLLCTYLHSTTGSFRHLQPLCYLYIVYSLEMNLLLSRNHVEVEMGDRERYRAAFQRSREVVKEWEATFLAAHSRKPNREELQQAPEQVLICYKNCKKIRHYFDKAKVQEDVGKKETTTQEGENEHLHASQSGNDVVKCTGVEAKPLSFSGLFSAEKGQNSLPEADSTAAEGVKKEALTRGAWGQHMNRKAKSDATSTNNTSSQLAAKLAVSYEKTTFRSSVTSTRTSLKKRCNMVTKSRSFFGSLGDDSSFLADLSQASFLDESQASAPNADSPTLTETSSAGRSELSPVVGKSKASVGDDDDDDGVSMPAFSSSISAKSSVRLERSAVDAAWLQRCSQLEAEEPAVVTTAARPPSFNILAHVGGGGDVDEASTDVLEKEAAVKKVTMSTAEKRRSTVQANTDGGAKEITATKPELTSFKGLFVSENLPPANILQGKYGAGIRMRIRIYLVLPDLRLRLS